MGLAKKSSVALLLEAAAERQENIKLLDAVLCMQRAYRFYAKMKMKRQLGINSALGDDISSHEQSDTMRPFFAPRNDTFRRLSSAAKPPGITRRKSSRLIGRTASLNT